MKRFVYSVLRHGDKLVGGTISGKTQEEAFRDLLGKLKITVDGHPSLENVKVFMRKGKQVSIIVFLSPTDFTN